MAKMFDRGRGTLALGAAALVMIAGAVSLARGAGALELEVPVDCDMERVCSIQKYVDHDPSAERMDYACGRLSKDGDTGTDFRVPDYPAMERGVRVLAAAPGVVKAVRDGMADVSVREIGQAALAGRMAGNGVVIDHGDGFETQYSHLRQGSVTVEVGQRVDTGEKLGLIGLSGNSEFPHVEFAVRHHGTAVDPFVGLVSFTACGDARAPLWSEAASARLPYRASVALSAGFAAAPPNAEAARRGLYSAEALPPGAAALVYWVDVSGAQTGDREHLVITGPAGRIVHERESRLEADAISRFVFAGVKRPAGGWPRGVYRGDYTLNRDGQTVVRISRSVALVE